MKTAIVFIVLLALVSTCFSAPFTHCRCPRANKRVRKALIAEIEIINPRPFCKFQEVIAKLTDGKSVCLDPKEKFTWIVIKAMKELTNATQSTNTASAITMTTTS